MNERLLQYWTNVKQYWNRFNKTSKLMIVGIFIAMLLTIILFVYNNSKIEYATAFTDLQPNDAASITKYLTDGGIPYKISEDGKSIGVPRKMVSQVKVDVVGQGLTKSGSIGWGVFRENSIFGKTDAQTRIMELEALQGELEQLINTNVAISGSKVLVTRQDDGVFLRQNQPPTASIMVNTKPGYVLDQQKIDTMYLLVSKSVPNLTVENITISDQNGDLLPYSKSSAGQLGATSAAAQQFQIKKDFEQDLRKEITRQLGSIAGANNVMPMVVATFNYDKKTQNSDLVTPVNGENGIVVSSNVNEKSSTGVSDGGVAGTGETDVPTYPSGANGGGTSEESSRTYNYEFNRIKEVIESQPFFVNDLMISVGINRNANLTDATKTAIQRMLTSLVATSLANNGRTYTAEELAAKVTVFDETFAEAAPGTGTAAGTNWLLYGGIGAAAAALAAVGGFAIASRRRKARELEAMEEEAAIMVQNANTQAEFPSIDLDNLTNDNQARKQLEQLAKKKPEEFVNLLRTWLVDE
ncbi:flagellar M-ring protein FliF [Paenibacillus sp. YN15]|nr:flagellar M-ring protein FliF [Paenibacillus sp. YN15]